MVSFKLYEQNLQRFSNANLVDKVFKNDFLETIFKIESEKTKLYFHFWRSKNLFGVTLSENSF